MHFDKLLKKPSENIKFAKFCYLTVCMFIVPTFNLSIKIRTKIGRKWKDMCLCVCLCLNNEESINVRLTVKKAHCTINLSVLGQICCTNVANKNGRH